MRSDSGGVIPERIHGEATWQESAADEGGGDREGGGGVSYVVYLPRVLKTVRYQVPGWLAVAHSAGWMREHFMYRHFFARLAVVQ